MDYLCNSKSEISNVCNAVEGHCLQVMKIVHHHVNGRFDGLISEHQSGDPSRDVIPILSRKYKGFTLVHPVLPMDKVIQFSSLRKNNIIMIIKCAKILLLLPKSSGSKIKFKIFAKKASQLNIIRQRC